MQSFDPRPIWTSLLPPLVHPDTSDSETVNEPPPKAWPQLRITAGSPSAQAAFQRCSSSAQAAFQL